MKGFGQHVEGEGASLGGFSGATAVWGGGPCRGAGQRWQRDERGGYFLSRLNAEEAGTRGVL